MSVFVIKPRFWVILCAAVLSQGIVPLLALNQRPQSARAFGMGDAFVAISDDSSAVYYNPAGLGIIRHVEAAGSFARIADAQQNAHSEFAGIYTVPSQRINERWDFGTFAGVLDHNSRPDDYSNTHLGGFWGSPVRQSIPRRWLGSKYRFLNQLYGGAGLQIVRAVKPSNRGLGLGIDLGALYFFEEGDIIEKKGWSLGFALQQIQTPNTPAGVLLRFGTAWRNPYSIAALDLTMEEGKARLHPGVEFPFFRKLLRIRAGTHFGSGPSRQITLGLGTFLPPMQMDIAYAFPWFNAGQRDDQFVFSFTYRFGMPLLTQYLEEDRRTAATQQEARVAELEDKAKTLKSLAQESQQLSRDVNEKIEKLTLKRNALEEEIKTMDKASKDRKADIENSQRILQTLQMERSLLEKKIHQLKLEAKRVEIRPPGVGATREHEVLPGDSLRSIADKYYGRPDLWKVIYDANRDKMKRGTPKVGELLKIP